MTCRTIVALGAFLGIAIVAPQAARADPVLLGEYKTGFGSASCGSCSPGGMGYYDISSIPVARGGPITDPTVVQMFGFLDGVHDGYGIATGTVGSFDFDASNAPGFAALAGRLTDGRNDNLVFVFPGFNANDRAGEPQSFSVLAGQTIDFLRLNITQDDIQLAGTGFTRTFSANWQVWGGGPMVSPVPEPETLTMWALGIGLLAWASRRRRRR
jgi:hypothetical protein